MSPAIRRTCRKAKRALRACGVHYGRRGAATPTARRAVSDNSNSNSNSNNHNHTKHPSHTSHTTTNNNNSCRREVIWWDTGYRPDMG